MPKRSRRGEIRKLLALRKREGLTYAELSERSGIPAATLTGWSYRLRKERGSGFTELKVVEEAEPSSVDDIRLVVNGVTVEVHGDFDAALLARLVTVLRDQC